MCIQNKKEMLPCPFCGRTDLIVVSDKASDDNDRIYAYHVHCRDCGASGRNTYPHCWCESEEHAIEAWNDRYIPATLHDGEDRVKISTTALLHIHSELGRIENIERHISDLLTPIKTNIEE